MPPNRNHPETLHYLARLLVGVTEADQARDIGGMHYDLLIQRVKDVRAAGLKPNPPGGQPCPTTSTPPCTTSSTPDAPTPE